MFHFAGIGDIVPSIERPIEYMSVNVQGTVHVLECAARTPASKKFVYAASSSCYGLAATPTREDHPIAPQYPYALSKLPGRAGGVPLAQGLSACRSTRSASSTPTARARGPPGAYGAVFGVFLKQKLAGKPFTVVGDGTQSRDFLYVTDVAAAFLLAAADAESGEIWNLGAGNPQSVNRLVELLGGAVVRIPKRPGEPDCTLADIGKIRRELGWAPQHQLRGGRRSA